MLFPADLDGAPVAPPEGRWKRKRVVRIEGPRTLFLIFGKSDSWWFETFSHGNGTNVDQATRLVGVALGSCRLVSRNDETSHGTELRMCHSAEKLLGRFAPHFLLYCASLVAKLEAPCVANPDQDREGLFADAGDASVLVHEGGLFPTRQQQQRRANKRTSKQMGQNKKERPTCAQRK